MHCSGAIKISEFGKWKERHNGGHVIHVTRRWRHSKQHRHVRPVTALSVLSGWQVADRVWINSRSRRHFQWICNFWIPRQQGGIILGLQSNCGHPIDINMSIPCEIVRPSGEVVSSHFDRSHIAFYLIANEAISFDVSLNVMIPGLLHVIHN